MLENFTTTNNNPEETSMAATIKGNVTPSSLALVFGRIPGGKLRVISGGFLQWCDLRNPEKTSMAATI